jgi:RND family efflux transporter MFP subunit
MGWKKSLLISFGILIVSLAILGLIFSTEPEAERSGTAKESAMLVEVEAVERGTFTPIISATGTVQASQEIMLGARVEGEVTFRSSNFVPGSYLEKGDVLLQIDSTDYVSELMQARAELRQVESELQQELGLQEAAKREYELYGDTLSEVNQALVLRQPQLKAIRAQVESAQASVDLAERNLDRTTVRSPFNAYILDRTVNLGSQVSPGQELGQLVGIDTYWVEAAIPLSKIRWLEFNEDGSSSAVRVRNRTAWPEGEFREGSLYKMLGSLDDQTRMARVLIEVEDPRSRLAENLDQPQLIIGSFVETNIAGRTLQDVARVNRDYMRSNETIWVMEGDSLSIRELGVEFQDSDYAYVSSGLEGGDQVVTTNLATVTEGAPLRLEGEEMESTENGETE